MKMQRNYTILAALLTGILSVAPAIAASPPLWVPFAIDTANGPGDKTPHHRILLAQSGPDFYQVSGLNAGDTLNVRSGPGTGYRVLGVVRQGEVVRNLGCRDSGAPRWCQIENQAGTLRGWASGRYLREAGGFPSGGGNADVPEILRRTSGEIEVMWASGCTMLYNQNGRQIQAGGTCNSNQRSRSDDAVLRFLNERGAGGDDGFNNGGQPIRLSGVGSFVGGGPISGSIQSNNGRNWALVITGAGFTCTGSMTNPAVDTSQTPRINCTDGRSGLAIIQRNSNGRTYTLTFNLSDASGGLITMN